ncbi:hypothetical protein [Campylobacter suis]|uniref:Uncharacterized protein n=1 Tax=Campylobacter suis TaxID=2790657 RepID=A0ABM8Q1D5_9BACT|nr:hypothetical protein [Campylobacter suis]CAD7286639.1 hypothetical protein LMG8286_00463 [Campylobacter suis]
MDSITQKEKLELEEVFAAIYTKKDNKFIQFYKEFYAVALINIKNLRNKIFYVGKK